MLELDTLPEESRLRNPVLPRLQLVLVSNLSKEKYRVPLMTCLNDQRPVKAKGNNAIVSYPEGKRIFGLIL